MFTDNFVKYLQNNNISAYSVAKNTGISQGLMNEYKNGVKLPTIHNLVKIADYLDCSVDYLLDRTDNPSSHSNEELDRYELELLTGFRSMSDQGKEYILETMAMAKERYKKDTIFTELKKEVN